MFDQKKRIPSEQDSDSLENSTNKHLKTMSRRGFIALLGGTAAGCAAKNYFPIDPEDEQLHKEFMEFEYGQPVNSFAKESIEVLDAKGVIKPYETSAALKEAAGKFTATSTEGQAFVEMERQNKYLSQLFDGFKVNRYVLHSVQRNTDYEGWQSRGEMTKTDLENVLTSLKDLDTSLRTLTFDNRKALDAALKDNKDYQEMRTYNERTLSSLNKLSVAIADGESVEGHLREVYDANKLSANIIRSTTGHNQYGDSKGEGAHVLEVLCNQKVKDVVSARSIFAKTYSDPEMKIKDAYDDIMKNIWNEAKGWDDSSLHTISNNYLASALNMAKEARKNGLISNKQYQGVVRVITKDAIDKIGNAVTETKGINAWRDILAPAFPGYSIVSMFLNAGTAFSKDTYRPRATDASEAYAEMLGYGNASKNGFATRWNYAGSTNPAVVRFTSASISTAMQVGAGIYLINASKSKSSNGSAGSSGTPPVGGGEGGSPGTGPR